MMPSEEFKQLHYVQLPNGEKYAYRKTGNNEKVLLLVHGILSSSAYFSFLIPYLASDFTLIAPDLRGFGHSSYNKILTSHDELAEDLKLFVEALNIPKCSILGVGIGGGVTFIFGAKYPEKTEKVILFGTFGPKGLHPEFKEIPKTVEEFLKYSPFYSELYDDIELRNEACMRKLLLNVWSANEELVNTLMEEAFLQRNIGEIGWLSAKFNVSNETNKINIPGNNLVSKFDKKALIFAGENDKICPPEAQKEWQHLLGEKATLKLLPGCGHGPNADQAGATANILKQFLIDNW
jgi:pimeloyl-ACP methyl ester carboxylesterase